MGRGLLLSCLPWLTLLVASFLCLWLLVRLNETRPRLGRLRHLHADQAGSVQTLSFVLVLPFFVMIMLFIVQVSQLMIGQIVVEYAAYAAARSAIVWIPARVGSEPENCISWYMEDPEATDQVYPVLDPTNPAFGPAASGGVTYLVAPGSPKYEKIRSAAVMACMPIAPSRDLGLSLPAPGGAAAEIIKAAYGAIVPDADSNARIPRRLENKLAYAMQDGITEVEIRFYHTSTEPEPPLQVTWNRAGGGRSPQEDRSEFLPNEIGWQDPITVTVKHKLALLPGPGRFLARPVRQPDGSPDDISEMIDRVGDVYVYPLEASATLGNEGEKSVWPYAYLEY